MDLRPQQQSMERLKQFWNWWLGELRQSVPAKVSHFFDRQTASLAVYVEANITRFQLKMEQGERLLGILDLLHCDPLALQDFRREFLSDLPAGVITQVFLSDEQLLGSNQYLPLATEANLGNVLGFEIDRLTPFPREQVVFGYLPRGRFPEREKIQVSLYALPRQHLDLLMSRLETLGLAPQAIFPEKSGGELSLNFLPAELRPSLEPLWNGRAKQLGIMAVSLLVVLALYPLFQLNSRLDGLVQQIDEIRAPATVVGNKQSLLAARLAAQDTLVARKNQTPPKLAIVQELTRLLPDNTWVSRLRVDDRAVDLQGESRKASDLIQLLEQSGQFQNVQFVSPITVNPATNMERYEIKMELAGVAQ